MATYVAYYRVSTASQARSGLGLEAQQQTVHRFLSDGDELIAEFVEVQSGRRDARVELAKALTRARAARAAILIARLDRFSRRVSFISGVMERGVRLVVAELPNATEFQLHIFAALAQEERRLISERTRLALQAAKARGVRLGQNGATLAARHKADAVAFADEIMPMIERIGRELPRSRIAAALNEEGYRSRRGKLFCSQTVTNVLAVAARSAAGR